MKKFLNILDCNSIFDNSVIRCFETTIRWFRLLVLIKSPNLYEKSTPILIARLWRHLFLRSYLLQVNYAYSYSKIIQLPIEKRFYLIFQVSWKNGTFKQK